MAHTQCEQCGAEFANEYKLFRHEQECSAGDEGGESTESEEETERVERTLKTFMPEDGYGFIVTADVTAESSHGTAHTEDVFVHISDTDTEELEEGDRLRFDTVQNEEGLKAEKATPIGRSTEHTGRNNRHRELKRARRMGFGHQADDTKYGCATGPTEQE